MLVIYYISMIYHSYFHSKWEMRPAGNTWEDLDGAPRINTSLEFLISVTTDSEKILKADFLHLFGKFL